MKHTKSFRASWTISLAAVPRRKSVVFWFSTIFGSRFSSARFDRAFLGVLRSHDTISVWQYGIVAEHGIHSLEHLAMVYVLKLLVGFRGVEQEVVKSAVDRLTWLSLAWSPTFFCCCCSIVATESQLIFLSFLKTMKLTLLGSWSLLGLVLPVVNLIIRSQYHFGHYRPGSICKVTWPFWTRGPRLKSDWLKHLCSVATPRIMISHASNGHKKYTHIPTSIRHPSLLLLLGHTPLIHSIIQTKTTIH